MTMQRTLIVAEQGERVFLSKPAGLPVFPPHAEPGGASLLGLWTQARPELAGLAWPSGFDGGLAHRLDTPTSGLVLACTSLAALRSLREEFASGALRKVYYFVTSRDVPWDRHELELPVAHDRRRRARMVVQRGVSTPHRGHWYPAVTQFSRVGQGCWRAEIRTGVTHQIRVHAAFVGLALAGDRLYGGGPIPADIEAPAGADFMLHHHHIRGSDWVGPTLDRPSWWGRYGSGS